MTLTPVDNDTKHPYSHSAELLIKEARRRTLRRRILGLLIASIIVIAGVAASVVHGERTSSPPTATRAVGDSAATSSSAANDCAPGGVQLQGTAASPFPATLTMQCGLLFSNTNRAPLPWGAVLPAAQTRWVTPKSLGPTYQWGVWRKNGIPGLFPVRSSDGGKRWTAAGPQLATDWVGGGIYYVTKVIPESWSTVVMVSNAVIDVTTDGGHQWYQYVNQASNWIVVGHVVVGGGIGIRVSITNGAPSLKSSYAIYVLNVAKHQWRRTAASLY